MAELTITEKMRTAHVRRWHIVRVAREQSIAEHMYLVWQLTVELCLRMKIEDEPARLAQLWALVHDEPEVVVGDLPTPTKRAMKVDGLNLFDELEKSVHAPNTELSGELARTAPDMLVLVKLADLIESLRFLSIERMDAHGDAVLRYLRDLFLVVFNGARNEYPGREWQHALQVLNEVTTRTPYE